MKELKKKILLALSLPVDFFKKSRGFIYQPYNFCYFLLNFQHGSIRDAMGQLTESGEVDKIVRNHVPFFRLTGVGRERLLSFFPISLGQARVWDRRWRVLIKESPCRPARRLLAGQWRAVRRKLKDLGFKKLSRGVYLTPMPVSEELKNYLLSENLLGKVVVVESRRLLAEDDKNLAKKIWPLEKMVKKYTDFIKKCQSLLKKMSREKRLKDQDKKQVVSLFETYFSLLCSDPGLPKKVLPADWPADIAREKFLAIFGDENLKNPLDII